MRRLFMILKFKPLNDTSANFLNVTISALCATLTLLACAPTDPLLRQAVEEVQKRPGSARIKLRPFAVQGNATAITQICIAYGRSLSSDDGVQERENAFAWCSQAAISGHAEAQYHLGNFYAWGIGTPEDRDLALRWYAQAASHGHAAAEDAQRGLEGKSAVCRNLITGCRLF